MVAAEVRGSEVSPILPFVTLASHVRALGFLTIGDRTPEQLRLDLQAHGVALNDAAQTLLRREEIGTPRASLGLVALTPAGLGFPQGAPMPDIFAAALGQGYDLCPLATGPYLRLTYQEAESFDPVLSRHRPPDGALHVASAALDRDFKVPRGFYLRTVGGQKWLRGFHCDDDYIVPATMTYVFKRPTRT